MRCALLAGGLSTGAEEGSELAASFAIALHTLLRQCRRTEAVLLGVRGCRRKALARAEVGGPALLAPTVQAARDLVEQLSLVRLHVHARKHGPLGAPACACVMWPVAGLLLVPLVERGCMPGLQRVSELFSCWFMRCWLV